MNRQRATQLSQARLRSALRISLSEVLAAFFTEGQGEEGVYRGLSLIGRCRDAGLPPYPFDFLGAMRVRFHISSVPSAVVVVVAVDEATLQ